jgi:DNA modification methylase
VNRLHYGDNLDVLRQDVETEAVDLVYLDPPFNSNRTYNVLFKQKSGDEANAQIQAFDDTWTWSQDDEALLKQMTTGGAPPTVADALEAMQRLIGPSDMLSYLVMMTARFMELRRVLKPTGWLYLHCDPTASHYLKVILDAVFGIENFRNEIVWQRTGAKGSPMGRLPSNHDIVLSYSRSDAAVWNEVVVPYNLDDLDAKTAGKYTRRDADGRLYQLTSLLHPEQGRRPNLHYELMGVTRTWRWSKDRMDEAVSAGHVVQTGPGKVPRYKRYLDEQKGRLIDDVWADIPPINSQAAERLGYPTQKPLALLERIISASSNEGDIVLDPFCGCGTTIDAAQRLGRRWIGIDITYLAIDLIDTRLRDTYGPDIAEAYEIVGIPKDIDGAAALFAQNPFDFERWAVSLVEGTPNQKQVGDKGSDGVIRFPIDNKTVGRAIVSVKGGRQVNPSMVRDLVGTVSGLQAEMGVLIVMDQVTPGMRNAAQTSGTFDHILTGRSYPRVQIISVAELLAGKRVEMPTPYMPYIQAQKFVRDHPSLPGIG